MATRTKSAGKKTTSDQPTKGRTKGVAKGGEGSTSQKAPLLPREMTIGLKNTSYRAMGLVLILLSFALLAALVTYSSADKSLNLAVTQGQDSSVANIMGAPGAIVANLLITSFGLAAFAFVLPLFLWGFKIIRMLWLPRFWLNLLIFPEAILALAVALALVATPMLQSSPLLHSASDGLAGGFIGALLEAKLTSYDFMAILPAWAWALVLVAVFLPLYGFSFALNKGEWQTVRRTIWQAIKTTALFIKWVLMGLLSGIAAVIRGVAAGLSRLKNRGQDQDYEYDEDAPASSRAAPRSARDDKTDARDNAPSPLVARDEDRVGVLKRKRVTKKDKPKRGSREAKDAQATLDFGDMGDFVLPPLTLLENPPADVGTNRLSEEALDENARMLENVLDDFGVQGAIVKVRPGPVVTLYELEPAPGTKSARVIGLSDDIARSMSAVSARVAVVPGRNAIGIELPNAQREMVYLRELLASRDFESNRGSLPLVLGKDIGGAPVVVDMAAMPHLLMAGRTGAGKSVGVNTFILSLLYRHSPETLRLILIDPKMLELSVYEGIPHLLTPVVTEAKKAVVALKWAVREMEDRYRNMSKLGVRNLAGYNKRVSDAKSKGETLKREVQTGFDRETGEPVYEEQEFDFETLPQIVIIIDEMADLMIVAGKDVEATIQRLAQMARAAGIHVVIATQRPSVDVITGTIKANFPTRVSFQVTSKIDSRTILGEQGAEQLLGKGDMLYMGGSGIMTRVHGAFVSDEEVEDIVRHLQRQGAPEYVAEVTEEPEEGFDSPFIPGPSGDGDDASNSLYDQAVAIVVRDQRPTTSYIQRRLKIGYNKAAQLIEDMEQQGVISAPNHKGQREVLVPDREAEF